MQPVLICPSLPCRPERSGSWNRCGRHYRGNQCLLPLPSCFCSSQVDWRLPPNKVNSGVSVTCSGRWRLLLLLLLLLCTGAKWQAGSFLLAWEVCGCCCLPPFLLGTVALWQRDRSRCFRLGGSARLSLLPHPRQLPEALLRTPSVPPPLSLCAAELLFSIPSRLVLCCVPRQQDAQKPVCSCPAAFLMPEPALLNSSIFLLGPRLGLPIEGWNGGQFLKNSWVAASAGIILGKSAPGGAHFLGAPRVGAPPPSSLAWLQTSSGKLACKGGLCPVKVLWLRNKAVRFLGAKLAGFRKGVDSGSGLLGLDWEHCSGAPSAGRSLCFTRALKCSRGRLS